ncbi:uncharacterized protein LOC126801880 [Argentina anserina]|uniref:uncharacterized protein LOC126801880 n=1 Tax=Argentina anserina TaxID=57926 RepID=UPI0021765A0B|nr:uncharacterized protein LOC126801880 [Potentilla anserina]
MGPELELKPNSEAAMGVSAVKETGVIHIDQDEKFMPCVSNYKDSIFNMEASFAEHTSTSNRQENQEINITGCGGSNDDVQMVEDECQDLTESSSSFGDTVSGTQNGMSVDGDEVESRYCANPSVSLYDGYSDAFHTRKKKLTGHWRKFIRPLMWRCKWLELQIKELQSQALKYDEEVEKYNKLKHFEYGGYTAEGFDGKSIPFSSQIQRSTVMKRKKRKRVEDTTDIPSFISNHKLFSYYENIKSGANGGSIEDDCGNLAGKSIHGINEFEIEFRDGDSTLEDTLRKIELVHSQVCQLKTRIDKVVKENPALFCSARSPALEIGNDLLAETLPDAAQHIFECNMGSFLLPGSAVSTLEGQNPLPGITEDTDQPWVGIEQENGEDGDVEPNAFVKKEPHCSENNKDQVIQKPLLSSAQQKSTFSVPASKTVPKKSSKPNATQQPDSTTRTEHPWNTRNRGKRKPGRWSKKS